MYITKEGEKEQIKVIKHATLNYTFHICNLFFNYTKILYFILLVQKAFYRDVTEFNQVPPTPAIYYHGEPRKICRPTYPQGVT